jgi:hypothetical protein
MQKLKTILGYGWAVLMIPVVLGTFMGMNSWAKMLVGSTGVTINPHYNGGEVTATVDHGTYQAKIHQAVFDGLLSEREDGFIQIDWAPVAKDGRLPGVIEEPVDFNRDGRVDFTVRIDTRSNRATVADTSGKVLGMGGVSLDAGAEEAIGVGQVYNLGAGRAVRVMLKK